MTSILYPQQEKFVVSCKNGHMYNNDIANLACKENNLEVLKWLAEKANMLPDTFGSKSGFRIW